MNKTIFLSLCFLLQPALHGMDRIRQHPLCCASNDRDNCPKVCICCLGGLIILAIASGITVAAIEKDRSPDNSTVTEHTVHTPLTQSNTYPYQPYALLRRGYEGQAFPAPSTREQNKAMLLFKKEGRRRKQKHE